MYVKTKRPSKYLKSSSTDTLNANKVICIKDFKYFEKSFSCDIMQPKAYNRLKTLSEDFDLKFISI